jgi:hypothetical protein
MAREVDTRLQRAACQRIKEKIGMKRILTILSAALFAGALMVPVVQAQDAPAAGSSMAAPAAEATPSTKKHHMKKHHHKKSTMSGDTGTSGTTSAPGAMGSPAAQ